VSCIVRKGANILQQGNKWVNNLLLWVLLQAAQMRLQQYYTPYEVCSSQSSCAAFCTKTLYSDAW
jgi:hypothetical protein